jgi:hypothetical protein
MLGDLHGDEQGWPQKSHAGRIDELIAGQKALKQALQRLLESLFK